VGDNNQLQEHVASLVTVLDEQIKIYRHLLEVVRKEKEILVAANLDDLNENNRAKEAMLIKIRALEVERIRVATHVAQELGLKGESPRLLDIANHLPDESGEKLRSIHSVLELLLKRVQEYNRQNEILVQSALNNITGAMNALKGSLESKPTYQKKGEVEGHTAAGNLVSRQV
jgi:flagellar biosynthesis/type III secretory pathway chaperone